MQDRGDFLSLQRRSRLKFSAGFLCGGEPRAMCHLPHLSLLWASLYVSRKMVKRYIAQPTMAHLLYDVFHRPMWKLTPQQNKEREGAAAHGTDHG